MADSNSTPPNFDFIMKQEPKPKRSFSLPANLPKPLVLGVGGVILLIIILIIGSIVNGGGKETDVYKVLSDASVISNTSQDADSSVTNTDIRTLAATTRQTMNSQEQQIKTYMTSRKIKIDNKKIKVKLDSQSSTQLQTAKFNNNYDAAYVAYLKSSLNAYQTDLKTTYQTSSPGLKLILNSAHNSNQVLLQNKLLQ